MFDGAALTALESLLDEGWLGDVLYDVKSGKEATVYCCRAGDRLAGRWPDDRIAAKVYRPRESRRFTNDAVYQTGRKHVARAGRARRAAERKSDFGRKLQYAMWLEHEWETMSILCGAGVDLPPPLARNDQAILMPFLGDAHGPAPTLAEVRLDPAAAATVADRLLANIELMLDHHRVHGDLSAFNVMYWRGEATLIDFPQAVDPRLNPGAAQLLERDVGNVCRWAARQGVDRPSGLIARDLWSRFLVGEIGA